MNDRTAQPCPFCQSGKTKRMISGFYLNKTQSTSVSEMRADLRENYGIESVQMQTGKFQDWYQGVKKDGARVKEQMQQGAEAQEKKAAQKHREFMSKPVDQKALSRMATKHSTRKLPTKK